MKVQVCMKVEGSVEAGNMLNLVVDPSDTVSSLKERVAIAHPMPFPDQDLSLEGEVLQDGQVLSDCGVKDQTSLHLVVKASETALVKQLRELLQARDLSCDELGLLYCYKHGASAGTALKAVGFGGKLQEFVKGHKGFQVEGGHVALVRESTGLKPFSATKEVEQILRSNGSGTMDIKELCVTFKQKFGASLNSIVGTKPADFLAKEKDLFFVSGRLVHLRAMQKQQQALRAAAAAAAAAGGNDDDECEAPPGLESRRGGATPPSSQEAEDDEEGAPADKYMDLHTRISGRSFNSKVSQALTEVEEALVGAPFLNIDHVVRGGAVAKGTAISGGLADAEVVVFLRGLPPALQEQWLPPLQKAVAGVLSERFSAEEEVRASEDGAVQLRWKGLLQVKVRFSPVFADHAAAVQALGLAQGPQARDLCAASLARERVQFVARQPGQVKVTIRLLKWWRDQQNWSGKLTRPTDEIMELMAIYSAIQTKPTDQRTAIANVMSLLSRFDELRIVWSNYYAKGDVWAPLLPQKPLLMDPVNPFVNVADPQAFDAAELMAVAKTTHFFW